AIDIEGHHAYYFPCSNLFGEISYWTLGGRKRGSDNGSRDFDPTYYSLSGILNGNLWK
ncbi:unnamed protein product, partial [marine sediment metagenome]